MGGEPERRTQVNFEKLVDECTDELLEKSGDVLFQRILLRLEERLNEMTEEAQQQALRHALYLAVQARLHERSDQFGDDDNADLELCYVKSKHPRLKEMGGVPTGLKYEPFVRRKAEEADDGR